MLAGLSLCAILTLPATALADEIGSGLAAPAAAITDAAVPTPLASATGPSSHSGIPFASWMLYPSFFAGAVFDSNVYQTPHGTAAVGTRLMPSIEADLDNGIHKTTLYANADAQLYPGLKPTAGQTGSTIAGRAGLAHIWSPTSDIVTHFTLDFTRQDGPFGSALVTGASIGSATSFVGAPTALNVAGYRQFTDQTSASLSVEKKLSEKTFVRVGAGFQDSIYEQPTTGSASSLSGDDYSVYVRGGYWVTPQVNAFVETGGNAQRYRASSFYDTNAVRVVGGLASDLIGLVRGEAYGGVQQQYSIGHTFEALTIPAFGGRMTYYPTEYLTIAATVDNGFGSAGAIGANPVLSANSTTLQARLQADYALFEYWRASVRGGYSETRYARGSNGSEAWLAGAGVSYNFWRNFALTFDYQLTHTNSAGVGALALSDNLVTAGVTYRY